MARSPRTSARLNPAPRPRHRPETIRLDTVRLEGGILSSGMLAAIVTRDAGEQADADYGIRKGLVLKDEVARFFRIGRALHEQFSATKTPSPEATVAHVAMMMREVFEFGDVTPAPSRGANDRRFAIALEAGGGRVPIVVATPTEGVETPSPRLALDGRRTSAASTVQDWLDATDAATWGIATDGLVIRVLRDNASLTRPAYVDVDLARIFEAEALGDFTAAWLLLHASRFGTAGAAPGDCPLERWRAASTKQGEVARDRLRAGVEDALASLGTGFLEHPANTSLRDAAGARPMAVQALFGECLQVVYRMIFLFAAEDRDLLHPPTADPAARSLYVDGYSMASLRARAARRVSYDAHHDLWEGVMIVFDRLAGLGDDGPDQAAKLGLPVLDGLFAEGSLALLEGARLSNRRLMAAVRRLAWLDGEAGMVPINWRDMETEELGSVYESLLELTPILADDGRSMRFAIGDETKGNQRKTSGSYYTPDSLVQALLDSALDPVLDRAEREGSDPVEGLLGLSVIDPACGSGHFLLAAARRIATRVSRLRGGGVADRLEFRHAMRDVVRRCIHGVDRNPMAIELAKVALWIETVDPGKPLGFLDANMRCGDSLLGVFDRESLIRGVPDAAYKPLTGDDDAAARDLARRNKSEKAAQGELGLNGGASALPPAWPLVEAAAQLRSMPEETIEDVAARRRAYGRDFAPGRALISMACDLYVAAFVSPKRPPVEGRWPDRAPTTNDVVLVYEGHAFDRDLLTRWTGLADQTRAFHWFLAFPDITDRGGFDVVIGNPPWEVMQLGEEEYFAQRLPEIAALKGVARKRAIAALERDRPQVFSLYESDRRRFEASNEFARASGRFDLSARGKVNTYALFAELFARLTSPRGRAGVIVPTGIATDARTAPFFAWLVKESRLVSLVDFENREGIFPSVHRSYKFCLLTLGLEAPRASFSFFLTDTRQMTESERQFTLGAADIARINPNTHTAPVFRSRTDAELTAKIYGRIPVLIDETKGREGNPWRLEFRQGLFNKTADGGLFESANKLKASGAETNSPLLVDTTNIRWWPITEGSYGNIYDHRFGTFQGEEVVCTSDEQKANASFEPNFELFIKQSDFESRVKQKKMEIAGYWIALRRVARSTDERTVLATALPYYPATYGWLIAKQPKGNDSALLLGNLNTIVFDYLMRSALSQPSVPLETLYQLPFIPKDSYSPDDIHFIVERVTELSYTSEALAPFARDLGFDGPPFPWNGERRAVLRAELDARYARLYGLTRDDLRFVLDPAEVRGPDYPSETFRVLRDKEYRDYNEYRTARLVLAAWDAEAAGLRIAAE